MERDIVYLPQRKTEFRAVFEGTGKLPGGGGISTITVLLLLKQPIMEDELLLADSELSLLW